MQLHACPQEIKNATRCEKLKIIFNISFNSNAQIYTNKNPEQCKKISTSKEQSNANTDMHEIEFFPSHVSHNSDVNAPKGI